MTRATDPGMAAVRFAHDEMGIDPSWVLWTDRGFTWWGPRVAQRVWAEGPSSGAGQTVSAIHAETDFLCLVPAGDEEVARVAAIARNATLSGLLLADDGSLRPGCAAHVHEGNLHHVKRIFATAAALQIAEVELLLDEPASARLGTPAHSRHPKGGATPAGESLPRAVRSLLRPQGEQESRWASPPEIEEVRDALARRCGCLPTLDSLGLGVEIPFGPRGGEALCGGESIYIQISTKERHPRLGGGLAMRLHLPFALGYPAQARLAMRLNTLERSSRPDRDFFGSWCPDAGPGPMFVSFLPNVLHEDGVLEDRAFAMITRARWLGDIYDEQGFGSRPGED